MKNGWKPYLAGQYKAKNRRWHGRSTKRKSVNGCNRVKTGFREAVQKVAHCCVAIVVSHKYQQPDSKLCPSDASCKFAESVCITTCLVS